MHFLLYLLNCIGAIFGIFVGGSNNAYKDAIIGLVIIAILIGFFFLFLFLLDKTTLSHNKALIFSILLVLAVIVLFSLISIIVELCIN